MTDLRCAVVTAAHGVSSAGTATTADRFLLVELPLPWPKPIVDHPRLGGLDLASAPQARLLAITDDTPVDRTHRVLVYDRIPATVGGRSSAASTAGYRLSTYSVETPDLPTTLRRLADAATDELAPSEENTPGAVSDLLICTQGAHDRCCGSFGTELYRGVRSMAGDAFRIWRTSHTGGHRFAPTGLSFPDGLMWSAIDTDLVAHLASRTGRPASLADHLRGCSAFREPAVQAADRAVFSIVGWPWVDERRDAELRPGANGDVVVELTQRTPDDGAPPIAFEVTVREGEPTPVPPCGQDLSLASKTSRSWIVDDVRPKR